MLHIFVSCDYLPIPFLSPTNRSTYIIHYNPSTILLLFLFNPHHPLSNPLTSSYHSTSTPIISLPSLYNPTIPPRSISFPYHHSAVFLPFIFNAYHPLTIPLPSSYYSISTPLSSTLYVLYSILLFHKVFPPTVEVCECPTFAKIFATTYY